jgi:hypothetical protein
MRGREGERERGREGERERGREGERERGREGDRFCYKFIFNLSKGREKHLNAPLSKTSIF